MHISTGWSDRTADAIPALSGAVDNGVFAGRDLEAAQHTKGGWNATYVDIGPGWNVDRLAIQLRCAAVLPMNGHPRALRLRTESDKRS